jgi:hypothetical protein
MTLDVHPAGIPTDRSELEGLVDPRPAWERVAYAWLDREVDAGQSVDPATLAREVSVAPGFVRDLVRVLRVHRQRDPGLSELRARLVRDKITDAYLTRDLQGGQPLDPAELAAEVGTTSTVRPPVAAHPPRRPADRPAAGRAARRAGQPRPANARTAPSLAGRLRQRRPTPARPTPGREAGAGVDRATLPTA